MANISTIKVGDTSYGIAPASHASTATTYGAASASNYGHVKLSDNYTSSAGAAASGIGASSLAVYNAYNTLNSNLSYPRYNNKKYSTEDNRLSITAETVTPTGHDITLNPNETLIVTYSCNNRGETANIELGYGLNTKSMLSFFVEISGVRQYRPASATFVYTNNTNANITLYGLTRINIDTELMYVDCNYIIIK